LEPSQARVLAGQLKVSERDVLHMNRRMASRDLSLNAPVSNDGESVDYQDTLVDEGPSPEAIVADLEEKGQRSAMLTEALAQLPERERHILSERRLADAPRTLESLGKEYGISRERVRQLEVRAFDKIKKTLRSAVANG
jgi:RNA polymerase sigma-32 factor